MRNLIENMVLKESKAKLKKFMASVEKKQDGGKKWNITVGAVDDEGQRGYFRIIVSGDGKGKVSIVGESDDVARNWNILSTKKLSEVEKTLKQYEIQDWAY